SWSENKQRVGTEVEVLVSPGEGRKDGQTNRRSGRAQDNRLVHFTVPDGAATPRPGDLVSVAVTYAAPHHLVADSGIAGGRYAVRRTAGGDAWEGLNSEGASQGAAKPAVTLGMPSIGAPASAPAAVPCCDVPN
ncbi:MAG: tRNA (N6-isopentenyl adenosine(37)-C2)-methylthiotransferase MiaB, partial [Ornithinimicrobium sp.]